jgi:histidine kinase
LTRLILRPLKEITQSSQRIANGHYDERIAVPNSDELAAVAINFNQMAEALERIEQQRIALIGNVSHELRTPLTGIEGYLEGVMDGVMPNDTETFAQMYQEVRRLRRLVDDLQALSRVEAGQISLRLEPFDLIPVIERIINQLQPQAMAESLTVKFEGPATQSVCADPDRTAQVLLNLIGNAIRYTPEGGRVTIKVSRQQRLVQMMVQDTGIGIPAESLPYIFERFYRVEQSRSRSSGGSGIGLTIARHLAWAMGGELTAASDGPGTGSTFLFSLPVASP